MFETLKSLFRVKEMRRKLFYVIGMIFVIRIGSQLPVPGVDSDVFRNNGFRATPVTHSTFLMRLPEAPLRVCPYLL